MRLKKYWETRSLKGDEAEKEESAKDETFWY